MKSIIIAILLQGVLVTDVSLSSTKTWLRNINFNNSLNWDLGRVPCSGDNVIFPRSMGFVVQLPEGVTTLRQLVLPLDGELLLPLNGKLQMYKPNDKSDKCQGKDIIFSQWKSSSWMDPNSWTGHNSATPDLEAIPCSTDSVIFPPRASFSVVMPNSVIHVGALSIAGKQFQTSDWSEMMLTDEGQAQFFTENGRNMPEIRVTGQLCSDITGCDCKNEHLMEDVCNFMRSKCRNTPCLDPVTPYGNCCPICGAYLLFKYNERFSKTKFEKYLADKISDSKIDFHVSKVHGKIQVVLFEKEKYQEKAQSLADEIVADVMKRSDLGLAQYEQHVAGALVTPINLTKQAYIFLGFMFVAICTIGVIFYSYTDACKINIQDGRHYGFAIFQNQSEEVELCGPNGSAKKVAKSSNRQAFDNPMYGSTSEVEQVNQDVSEECPIYSMLEEIKLEKDDYKDPVESVDDLLNASN